MASREGVLMLASTNRADVLDKVSFAEFSSFFFFCVHRCCFFFVLFRRPCSDRVASTGTS